MSFLNVCTEQLTIPGGYRHVIGVKPIAYNDAGTWRRIVNDYVDGDANFPHINHTSPIMTYVAADGMRRLCPTRDPNVYVEIGAPYIKPATQWQKVSLGTPARAGGMLTYTTAQANVYLANCGYFVKLGILLKGGWQPPGGQFAFPVGMSGLTRTGGTFYADGVPVLTLRAPHVEDYANPDDVRPIAWEPVKVGSQWYILFTLPSLTGMAQPLIDPNFSVQPDSTTGQDDDVMSGNPTYNSGVKNYFCSQVTRKGLLKFNCSSIPVGSTCISATLYLYHDGATTAGAWNATVYQISAANGAWIEGTKGGAAVALAGEPCWNALAADGAGGVTTAWAGSAGLSTVTTDYESAALGAFSGNRSDPDATEYAIALTAARVQGWFGAVHTNYGMLIVSDANTYGFKASEATTAAARPKLVIDYTPRHRQAACAPLFVY